MIAQEKDVYENEIEVEVGDLVKITYTGTKSSYYNLVLKEIERTGFTLRSLDGIMYSGKVFDSLNDVNCYLEEHIKTGNQIKIFSKDEYKFVIAKKD